MKTPIQLSLDRFEGDSRGIAVLIDDDGAILNVPRAFLPAAAKAGDVLRVWFEIDVAATETLANQTRDVQRRLSARDSGGDVTL